MTIPVLIMRRESAERVVELFMPPEETWTEREAAQLLALIFAELRPRATHRLRVQPVEADRGYRLEVECDSGTAGTPPLAFSPEARRWWHAREVFTRHGVPVH